MKKINKVIIATLAIIHCQLCIVNSQTLTPKVNPSSGGYSTGTGVSLSWTMGETHTVTLQNDTTIVTQGEEQPELDILTGTINGSPFCAGSNISVSFTVKGFYGGINVFTAQLSDGSGSFANPVNIGTLSSTVSGIISAIIPSNTLTGTGYRIRVIANLPGYIGKDNGNDITINALPSQPGSITGNSIVCHGTVNTYSISPVVGAISYTWTLPSGWTGVSTSTSIIATAGTTSGNVSVTANGSLCISTPSQLAVTVNTGVPSQPGSIIGSISVCHNSTQTYSIAAVIGATSYIWTLPSGWTGTSTSTNITVTTGTLSGNITVKASNNCGNSPQRTLAVVVIANPARPGLITGNTTMCSGTTQVYSIAAVTGATSYTWTLPSGWTGTSSTTSVTVTSGTSSGIITVVANNTCGSSLSRALTVNITPNPATPGPISGSNSVCSGTTQTYSITAVSGATSYIWTLPSGWTGSSTTTSITATAGSIGGNISVLSVNNCGISNTSRTLVVSVLSSPAQTGSISGNTSPCQGTSQIYYINAVAGASGYTWTLPSGWSGTSTTTSITTTAGASGGTISVFAHNNCGTSNQSNITVNVNIIPTQPGAISGNTSVCQGTSQTYSVTPVSGATSYIWTKPTGWAGTSTSNSITFTVSSNSGNVTVKAINSCGNSPVQSLAITAHALTAVIISGNPNNYNFCAQVLPTSVIMTASSGYSSYIWSPSGGSAQTATVSSVNTYMVTATNAAGCTTTTSKSVIDNCALPTSLNTTNILGTSAKVTWIESQCRYNYTIQISVHGLNSWTQHTITPTNNYTFTGLSLSTTYDWQIQTNCNTSGTINSGWTTIQTFTTASSRLEEDGSASLSFNVYPNPANGMATIAFSSMEEGAYSIRMIDIVGRIVKSETINANSGDNTYIMNLDGIAKGVYTIILQKGDNISKGKLVVE